jgi:hypothetical protein
MAKQQRPFVNLPCAAHSANLIVKHTLRRAPAFEAAFRVARDLRGFSILQNEPGSGFRLPEASDTRWASDFRLVDRILEVQPRDDCPPNLKLAAPESWMFCVLCEFFKPIAAFIDIVQKANATQLDVLVALPLLLKANDMTSVRAFEERAVHTIVARINKRADRGRRRRRHTRQ